MTSKHVSNDRSALARGTSLGAVRCDTVSRPGHRSAKTLLEVVVMISILSVVVGLSATTLATLYRVRRQTQLDSEQRAALHRLAMHFRADAHDALSARVTDHCEFMLPDGRTIHYAFASPNVTRQLRKDDTVLHHDTFRLSRTANATFEQPENEKNLIQVTIRPIESRLPPRDTPRSATIDAVIGLNSFLAQIARSP
jgi:type II secretory pathway pseudopilin PulG